MINLYQGNSADFDVTVTLDDAAYQLATHKVWFTVKSNKTDADTSALIQVTTLDGITITDAALGKLRISLTPEQTQALPLEVVLECDVQLRTPEGKVYSVLFEQMLVSPRVTKSLDYV